LIGRVALFALLAGFSLPARGASPDGPPLPYVDRGACPFECCTYREWTVEADTPVRTRRDLKALLLFTARKGESVYGLTGAVVTLQPGRVSVTQDTQIGEESRQITVPAGTVLYSLHYLGEGYSLFWHRGTIFPASAEDMKLRPESDPKTVWWVLVENAAGDVGWSERPDNFGNKDRCG
jgi:hypothetical protein